MDLITLALVKKLIGAGTAQAVSDYLGEHLTNPTNPPIDNSLTIENAAADAKATGDGISATEADLHKFKNEVCEITIGDNLCDPDALTVGYLNSDGTINSALDYYETTDYIPVEVGKTYFIVGFGTAYGQSVRTRYLGLLYDENKNPISGTYTNVDNVYGISVTVSADNARYLRACGHVNRTDHIFQVEVGDAITYMKLYKRTVSNIMELPQLDDLKPLVGIATKVTGANLLNMSNKVVGFISSNIGVINEIDTYWTTDYIPVKADQEYIFSQTRYNSRMIALLYDEDKNAIPSTYVNDAQTMEIAFTPSVDGFVRLSTTVSIFNSGNPMLTEGSSVPSAYIPYKENYVLSNNVVFPESATENTLRGKTWCHCGDSFSASTDATFDSGIYSGENRVFPRLIASRNSMDLISVFFQSGRTLAFPSDGTVHNSLTDPTAACYYQNIPEDVDYITIMLGINDSHHENGIGGDGEDPTGIIPIGTISDSTTATYYGAWNVVLSWLIAHRPFAHIGIIVSNGCDREAYRTAQIEIARKYGVPFIDLNGDDRTPVMIRSQNPNIASSVKAMLVTKQAIDPDGTITGTVNTHPNWQAHEYESTFIEDFLRSI